LSISFQNLTLLKNLYLQRIVGFEYSDPFAINKSISNQIPNDINTLKSNISTCHLCDLSKSRTQSMIGFGDENSDIMIIDYSVSQTEDEQNSYFVGRSGEILKNMCLNVLKLRIEDIYFTHTIKCKPLNANKPSISEANSCKAYLLAQIEFIKPKIIITLGQDAYENLTNDKENFENIRGHICDFKEYKLVPIYHPNYLLRNPKLKKETLNDLNIIRRLIDNHQS
jgi:DNA polymerase